MMQQPTPQMPVLDPANPHQMFAYFTAWLYATDPRAVAETNRLIGDWAADLTKVMLEEGLKGMGVRRGDPQERDAAYTRKYAWPTAIDPQSGMLLHPGEDLWLEEMEKFPRFFHEDAMDAMKLGSPLPDWVKQYALGQSVAPETPAGPLRPLQDTLGATAQPAPIRALASSPAAVALTPPPVGLSTRQTAGAFRLTQAGL